MADIRQSINKHKWLWAGLALFCLLHVLVFTRGFDSGGPDVESYYQYATWMRDGLVPYRDFSVEYPPGALLVFLIPQLLTKSLEAYNYGFAAEMLVFNLVGLLLAVSLGRRLNQPFWQTLVIYTLSILAVGSIMVQRFDLAPAALTLAALFFFCRGNYKTAWALLAIGTLIKFYPMVLVPIFLIYQLKRQNWRGVIAPVLVFVLIILAVAAPFLWIDHDGFTEAFYIQAGRALQIESSYASVLMLGHNLGFTTVETYQGDVSFDLASPFSGTIEHYSFIVMAAGLLMVYFCFWRRCSRLSNSGNADAAHLLNYSVLAILMLLITSKVLSPQFMVWLLPLVPLVSGSVRYAIWLAFLVAGYLTRYIFPVHYFELIELQSTPVNVLVLRNVLLVIMTCFLLREPDRSISVAK
jgi:uncharacterized membrane protein